MDGMAAESRGKTILQGLKPNGRWRVMPGLKSRPPKENFGSTPQRLKPVYMGAGCGMAEAMP